MPVGTSTPSPGFFEKHEIPTVSEFDEIRLGCWISRDDSNSVIRFFIRDLEKSNFLFFGLFRQIAVLPFFAKFEFYKFSLVLQEARLLFLECLVAFLFFVIP